MNHRKVLAMALLVRKGTCGEVKDHCKDSARALSRYGRMYVMVMDHREVSARTLPVRKGEWRHRVVVEVRPGPCQHGRVKDVQGSRSSQRLGQGLASTGNGSRQRSGRRASRPQCPVSSDAVARAACGSVARRFQVQAASEGSSEDSMSQIR
jgi:hypothetical protein